MTRLVALDLGSRRIGVAASDELALLASPRGTIFRRSLEHDLDAIATLVRELGATRVILGHPIGLAGQATRQTRTTERFARTLTERLDVPVELWDERHTSTAAREIVGSSPEVRRRGAVDTIAATILLQSYLDNHPELRATTSAARDGEARW